MFYLLLCSPHLSTFKETRAQVRVPENTAKGRYDRGGGTWLPPTLPALGVSELPRNQKWS